jgi:hypothetical protein
VSVSESRRKSGDSGPARAAREYFWFAVTLIFVAVLVVINSHALTP